MTVQDLIAQQPADCQARLREIHGCHFFDRHTLDFFIVANGPLNEQKLAEFERFVAGQNKSKTAAAPAKRKVSAANNSMVAQAMRIVGLGASKPSQAESAGAAAATPASGGACEAVTPPASKRLRNEGHDESPESAKMPQYRFAAKSSVFEGSCGEERYEETSGGQPAPAQVRLLGDSSLWTGPRQGAYTWMDESLDERTAARDARLCAMEENMLAAVKVERGEDSIVLGQVGVPTQAEVLVCGRVVCEGLDGRLNERSMLLEGSQASSKGARVQLSVTDCASVAAFPGQIVGVVGRSGTMGTTFHAKEIVPGIPPSLPSSRNERPVRVMVAAGPFCLRSDLDYTPLEQVLEHAKTQRPQVLLLMGPFLDAANQKVASGETHLPNSSDPCSYSEFYERRLLPILRRGLAPLRSASPPVEVLIVPSLEEALSFHPMPQPPLDVALAPMNSLSEPLRQIKALGVRFLPNPAHIEVNGLRMSITSADALSPVLREIVLRPHGKKIEEAHRLLLRQRTLFPVVPRDAAHVSEARAGALDFPGGEAPDVCVFPSLSGTPTGAFVECSVVVNPGSLCRPAALGTFAMVRVSPAAKDAGAQDSELRGRARVDVFNMQTPV